MAPLAILTGIGQEAGGEEEEDQVIETEVITETEIVIEEEAPSEDYRAQPLV